MPDEPPATTDATTDAAPAPAACESCGSTGEELTYVQRVYVTPAAWDTEEKVELAGFEWWCFACRTHYPHTLPD